MSVSQWRGVDEQETYRWVVISLVSLGTAGAGPLMTLGAEGVLPGGYIKSLLRVFKQLTHILPSGEKVGKFSMYSLL